jgi:hypothetical protein
MVALVIELILIATIIVPMIVTSPEPARAVNRGYCGRSGNARRGK